MAATQVEEIYTQIVKRLSLQDRLRLATMILSGIPPTAAMDYSEKWSVEDLHDVTIASLRHAALWLGHGLR